MTAEDGTVPPGSPPDRDPEPPLPAPPALGWRAVLARGVDLNVEASAQVRATSIRIGLLVLAAGGPIAIIVVALAQKLGGLDALIASDRLPAQVYVALDTAGGSTFLVFLIGAICLIALSVDIQLLAVIVIAARATGRPYVLRRALELVRMRFWRLLRASLLIGVILYLPRLFFERSIAPSGASGQTQLVLMTVVGIVLSIPFAYVAAAIVLGSVGARESVRRSWRLARARPSLAILIAIVNVAFQTIAGFALGAGFSVLFLAADTLGLEEASGLGLIVPLGAIVAVGIVAAASLTMTIAALTAAPQVVAFLGLTGVSSGLDVLHDPDNPFATPRTEPLVSRPMKIGLAAEAILTLIALSQLL